MRSRWRPYEFKYKPGGCAPPAGLGRADAAAPGLADVVRGAGQSGTESLAAVVVRSSVARLAGRAARDGRLVAADAGGGVFAGGFV